MGLVFVMDQSFLRNLDFVENRNLGEKDQFCAKKVIFLSFGDIFIFRKSCAIQTNLGTKKFLRKNCAREYGLLANRIRN